MKKIQQILEEIEALLKEGQKLLQEGQKNDMALGTFGPKYEIWYTKSQAVVAHVIPERLPEFKAAYRLEKRKIIQYDTYTISDFLIGLRIKSGGTPIFNHTEAFAVRLVQQVGIVNAAFEIAPSVLRNMRVALRAELLDGDLHASRELIKSGHLRSAGVVCGVVLEAHLLTVCERYGVKVSKKDPAISDLNDLLKSANIYDVPTWRLIQRLADIRNLCGHRKMRDPKKDEVEDLCEGTDKIVKEVL